MMRRYERAPDGDVARRAADGPARGRAQPQLSSRPWPSAQATRSPSRASAMCVWWSSARSRGRRRPRTRARSRRARLTVSRNGPRGPRRHVEEDGGVEDHERRVAAGPRRRASSRSLVVRSPWTTRGGSCAGDVDAPRAGCPAGTPCPARSAAPASGAARRR